MCVGRLSFIACMRSFCSQKHHVDVAGYDKLRLDAPRFQMLCALHANSLSDCDLILQVYLSASKFLPVLGGYISVIHLP